MTDLAVALKEMCIRDRLRGMAFPAIAEAILDIICLVNVRGFRAGRFQHGVQFVHMVSSPS